MTIKRIPSDMISDRQTGKKVSEQLGEVTTQLAEKVSQEELNTTNSKLDAKRDKSALITMSDLSQDVKTGMTGGSVAVVGDGAVAYNNLATDLKNDYFGKNEISDSRYIRDIKLNLELGTISGSTGLDSTTATDIRARTPYILVNKGFILKNLDTSRYSFTVFKYDFKKNFLSSSGLLTVSEYEVTESCYIRVVAQKTNNLTVAGERKRIRDSFTFVNRNTKYIEFEVGNISSTNGADSTTIVSNRARTKLIRVFAGDILTNSHNSVYRSRLLLFDEDKRFLSNNDITTTQTYTFSSNGYVRIVAQRIDDASVSSEINTINTNFSVNSIIDNESDKVEKSFLFGKSILNFGDSIALGGYAQMIANRNNMTTLNYAVGGATIAVVSGQPRILDQINLAKGENKDADYILFNGGTNDAIEGRTTLGVITSGYNDTYDESTFCGSFELTCKRLKLNWMGKKLIYIRVHQMDSRSDLQKTYGDAALQICKKWSIPVVDLYNDGGLNSFIPELKAAYTNPTAEKPDGDGTHPNGIGYQIFYVPPIEAKMKSL